MASPVPHGVTHLIAPGGSGVQRFVRKRSTASRGGVLIYMYIYTPLQLERASSPGRSRGSYATLNYRVF